MSSVKDRLLNMALGALLMVSGYMVTEKLGLLESTSNDVNAVSNEVTKIDVASKYNQRFMEEMRTIQVTMDKKLDLLSVELAKNSGEIKTLSMTTSTFNRNTEKDIARLDEKLKEFIDVSIKKLGLFEDRLTNNEKRLDQIEIFLRNVNESKGGATLFDITWK